MRSSILTLNTYPYFITLSKNTLSKNLLKYKKIFQYKNIKEMNITANVPSETDNKIDCLNSRDFLTTSSR